MTTLAQMLRQLEAGKTTRTALTEQALAAIADPAGEGARAFTKVYTKAARAAAGANDGLRAAGIAPGPLGGLPISVKDLFDIAGEPTPAGSRVLADAAPAAADAPAVARLRAAGAVVIGRTNMTEFAYCGLGLNPHYGTPLNPWDRAAGRTPGGSSSGAAVSVTDGMAAAAIGSDTSGSVRIPAAFCGLVGFKPSRGRYPMEGVLPLSPSLDTIGPLARSVACCARLDAVMAGTAPAPLPELPLAGLRLAVPQSLVLDDLDETVAATFGRALERLSAAGARIEEIAFETLAEIPKANTGGGFAAPESYAWHRALLAARRADYDPHVALRIQTGEQTSAADYIDLMRRRAEVIADSAKITAPYDAIALPTVAVVAPRLADLATDEAYYSSHKRILRNTATASFLDLPAISLPIHDPGSAPVGLMLMGKARHDRRLLAVAAAVEPLFTPQA